MFVCLFTVRNEICLFFVKGDCKQGEKCWRVHFNMPYKWEVKDGQTWSALPENEAIERDFCDPSKIHSDGSECVHFDSMTRGFSEVHRLSTVSSVTQPTYILTTEWAWFWEDEYGQWVQYASIKEMHRLSSITSEYIEKRYQEDQSAVVKFTAGQQSYELSFRDMTQKNETYGTIRMVRRRPVFVSTADTQAARSRRNGPRNRSQNFRAVPGFWDKSAIPDIGYKTVTLLSFDRDYQKVQELFNKTMRGFQITSIERVQNRDLWEVFQWKRDLMKKNNGGKNSKELHLFHGTDPKHIEAICRDNFDWRLCGTNGTVYGEGSYFARDAKYSHSYTSHSGVRSMFACRVLVGDYTRGNSDLRRPPPKGEGSPTLYDSCVDNVLNPSQYVVFERHQVYPEFLIKYDDGVMHWSSSAPAPPKTVSIQSSSIVQYLTSKRIQAAAAATLSNSRVPSTSTLSPSQAATTSSNPTDSLPRSSLPKPAKTPLGLSQSAVLMKPAPSSQLVDTTLGQANWSYTPSFSNLSHKLITLASTPSRTPTTPVSTPSRTPSTAASTPSRTPSTPASTPSRTPTTPASTPSYTLTTPASTPSYTITTPASTPSHTPTTPASTPSRTPTTPASTPSRTPTTPASTPSCTPTTPVSTLSRTPSTPASTPSHTPSTPASTPSRTFTTPASTPSRTPTTPASTPSPTPTTPASTPSRTPTTPASTPSRTPTTPASTPSPTPTTPASTASRTPTRPPSIPFRTLTRPPSIPSRTLTRPPSIPSRTLTRPPSIPSRTLTRPPSIPFRTLTRPPSIPSRTLTRLPSNPFLTLTRLPSNPFLTLTTTASTTSCTLSCSTDTPSQGHALSGRATTTLSASSTSHPLSRSSSLSTPYHTLSHSSYTPTYTDSSTLSGSPHSTSNTTSDTSSTTITSSRLQELIERFGGQRSTW
ncbi:mucin-2-like [Coregonus clupeaformis]|uniref:mucin-2-like n=1 Tax=Coregonus clupeaformis TaxID=59861 RepID=UPI001E1C7E2E|nr:mucin-2-like [Coregonus clupeaformis]